jgi:siroheme synthase
VVVENASLPQERRFALTLFDLPRIAEVKISGPAVIMLGDVYAPLLAVSADSGTLKSVIDKVYRSTLQSPQNPGLRKRCDNGRLGCLI